MAVTKLDKERVSLCRIKVSSSIENFREKLKKRTGLKEYTFKDIFKKVIFFGLYHPVDYFWFILHRGEKKVFWCGSDITNLSLFRAKLLKHQAKHYCENEVERDALKRYGIHAEICPMIFSEASEFEVSFQPSVRPNVWVCVHPTREKEYGLELIEAIADQTPDVIFHVYGKSNPLHTLINLEYTHRYNIIYHGKVPEEQFNEEIKNYQAGLRLNTFDGFGEVLAKSVLMGQYPISYIYYPHITYTPTTDLLIKELNDLKNKTEPNFKGQKYWAETLQESLKEVLA